jgi:hypothetical protein
MPEFILGVRIEDKTINFFDKTVDDFPGSNLASYRGLYDALWLLEINEDYLSIVKMHIYSNISEQLVNGVTEGTKGEKLQVLHKKYILDSVHHFVKSPYFKAIYKDAHWRRKELE